MIIALLLFLVLIFPQKIFAIYNPLSLPNNRYGIHIVDTNDIAAIPPLVNSTGGDWGYVTMVLSDADRDAGRWQNIFNEMRRLRLIPIIRLATRVEGANWAKPQNDRADEVVSFLNSLNWPIENRYVVLFNEPNQPREWGGQVNPEEYADSFVRFATKLKQANEDFFILPAGLDASSVDDEASFVSRMVAAKPEILTLMDGWTSHSYPNPAFSGSPYARGRGTLTTYDWELSLLRSLGLAKDLPVFITETGWEHSEGKIFNPARLSAAAVAANITVAAASVWTDQRIAAVTPFIFNYQDVPFDHFSWKKLGSGEFYDMYRSYQAIPKTKGEPRRRESYTLLSPLIPPALIADTSYTLSAAIRNDGQGILNPAEYSLNVDGTVPTIEPEGKGTVTIRLTTPKQTGPFRLTVTLTRGGTEILLETRSVTIVPPPSVTVRTGLGWRTQNTTQNVTVLVYDKNTLIEKFTGLTMTAGQVTAAGVRNIIPGNSYRVVIVVPGYLPRQVIGVLTDKTTVVSAKRLLPLDFNVDGQFTAADIGALVRVAPWTAVRRFFGP